MYNTAVGDGALDSNTSGSNNVAIGVEVLLGNTSGNLNIAIGNYALLSNTTGTNNTAIGFDALYWSETGNNNIALGYQAGCTLGNFNNDIYIGNAGVFGGENNTIRIGTSQTATYLSGNAYALQFYNTSDRNLKENLTMVSPLDMLDKVAALPISHWNYKGDAGTQHIGPMGQDFHAAFGLGTDDKHIGTIDEEGVALAAIQGLNQKLEQTRAENAKLKQQNDSLTERLNQLEATVKTLVEK
jgi:hypothetical protein